MNARDFIHRFVPAPDGNAATAPTLLLLHGTGGDENDLLELGRSLDPTANLLSPRGKILEHGMPRFFRRLAEGVFDEADLIHRTHELAGFIAAASGEYGFDPAEITAVGYSNGANIAASLLLLQPGVLKGAVLLRAMVPLIPETAPDLAGTRVFLASGRVDPILPIANARRLAGMLREAGAEVAFHELDTGHQLTSGEINAARAWLGSGLRLERQSRISRLRQAFSHIPPVSDPTPSSRSSKPGLTNESRPWCNQAATNLGEPESGSGPPSGYSSTPPTQE